MNEYKTSEELAREYAETICGEVESMTDEELYDYWADVLDVEYIIGADKKYKGSHLLITAGGPTAIINTRWGHVEVAWGDGYEQYPISERVRVLLDDWTKDMYEYF